MEFVKNVLRAISPFKGSRDDDDAPATAGALNGLAAAAKKPAAAAPAPTRSSARQAAKAKAPAKQPTVSKASPKKAPAKKAPAKARARAPEPVPKAATEQPTEGRVVDWTNFDSYSTLVVPCGEDIGLAAKVCDAMGDAADAAMLRHHRNYDQPLEQSMWKKIVETLRKTGAPPPVAAPTTAQTAPEATAQTAPTQKITAKYEWWETCAFLDYVKANREVRALLVGQGDEGKRATGNNRIKPRLELVSAELKTTFPEWRRDGASLYKHWKWLQGEHQKQVHLIGDGRNTTGRANSDWPPFSKMEELEGDRERVRPRVIAGGGHGAGNAAQPKSPEMRLRESVENGDLFGAFDDDADEVIGGFSDDDFEPNREEREDSEEDDGEVVEVPKKRRGRGLVAPAKKKPKKDEPKVGTKAQRAAMAQADKQHEEAMGHMADMSESMAILADSCKGGGVRDGGGDDGAGRIGQLETEVTSLRTEVAGVNGKLDAILDALTQKGN